MPRPTASQIGGGRRDRGSDARSALNWPPRFNPFGHHTVLKSMKRTILALASAGLLAAVLAGSAAASTWTVAKLASARVALPDPTVQVALYGIDCPTTSVCVAVGADSTIAATRNPTGGAGSWVVGQYGGTSNPETIPGAQGVILAGRQIRGVSCPSAGLCAAVSFDGAVYTSTDPANVDSWRGFRLTPPKTPNVHLGGISCPTTSLCVAAAYGSKVATSTNPTVEGSWVVTDLEGHFDLRGVSCASPSLCVAVGNEGGIVASTDPTRGPSAWHSMGTPGGGGTLNGIACPTTTLCVTGNAGQMITSTNPAGGPAAWRAVGAGSGLPVKAVSCVSASACAAIDNNADVMTSTDPTGGASAWPYKNVLRFEEPGGGFGNGMFGLSCPAASLCAAAGQDSQVLVSGDPFAPDSTPGPKGGGSKKRPRVVITNHPAKRLKARKGGVRVAFRFHAVGAASRFRCKISRHRFRRCRSPRRYRVFVGRKVFKVRAIGPTGARGPVTSFHFRVGGLVELPPWGTCPNAPRRYRRFCVHTQG